MKKERYFRPNKTISYEKGIIMKLLVMHNTEVVLKIYNKIKYIDSVHLIIFILCAFRGALHLIIFHYPIM